ncbi:MAG: hypothetical protein AB7Y46_18400, partial [Armatimonadota bacterium]
MRMHLSLAAGLILMAGACKAPAEHVTVADRAALLQALAAARPGDSILLAPGTYQGGLHVQALQGAEGSPIVLAAADPADPPLIAGGGTCL